MNGEKPSWRDARLRQPAGCPLEIWTPFKSALEHVGGEVDDIDRAKKALQAVDALTAKACARQDADRLANRWPRGGHIERLGATLWGIDNRTDDTLNDHARWLALALQAVLKWSRGQKARSVPPATPIHVRDEDEGGTRAVTRFNPFTGQAY